MLTTQEYFKTDFDNLGFFGKFGGSFIPNELQCEFQKIIDFYGKLRKSKDFIEELKYIRKHFQGRPTPISFCKNLTEKYNGAKIYLKREDLNHMGAHKLNHTMAEGLLAKMMGKKTLIAETGAGQHGVALATAAAYFDLQCEIHMGEIDIIKEAPNVTRMKLLGAKIIPVTFGQKTLKEAVDSAFMSYMKNTEEMFFGIGSVVGPHPYPMMIRDLQAIIGQEAREQFKELTGRLPHNLVACVGGGSNAIGLFSEFLSDKEINMYGVESAGKGMKLGEHASTITYGKESIIHGMNTLCLLDEAGNPAQVHSIASGLDYPGVGPEHAYLNESGRVQYKVISDQECLDAFFELSKTEGIIPALESSHALAFGIKLAKQLPKDETILINLSGRGDKDVEYVSNFSEYISRI